MKTHNTFGSITKKVLREFSRRTFLGDISICDAEFDILIDYLRVKYALYKNSKSNPHQDPLLSIALVQIGIRYYNGDYWGHVASLLNLSNSTLAQDEQHFFGNTFYETVNKGGKLHLGKRQRVNSILMHGFVADNYAFEFFDFLFAFYRIDLERNLLNLNRNTMNELIEIMSRRDNTGRTYFLKAQTANAILMNRKGCKPRIRWYLKLIDKAFWGDPLPKNSTNRLTSKLIQWKNSNETFLLERRRLTGSSINRGKKSFSSPYLYLNLRDKKFSLVLPSQLIRFQEMSSVAWKIQCCLNSLEIQVNPSQEGVTGYKTDEEETALKDEHVFSKITAELLVDNIPIRTFSIAAEEIRFFDEDGDFVNAKSLNQGLHYSVTRNNFIPTSDAIESQEEFGNLLFVVYNLMPGDLIHLPDQKPILVGMKHKEGFLERGLVSDVYEDCSGSLFPVYSKPPTLYITLEKRLLSGTALILNGEVHRLEPKSDDDTAVTLLPTYDRTSNVGIMIRLGDFGCTTEGHYDIAVHFPNLSARHFNFLLLQNLDFNFEEAPYIFKSRGTLCISQAHRVMIEQNLSNVTFDQERNCFNFDITPGQSYLHLRYFEYVLAFSLPVLQFKYANDEWQTHQLQDVWHANFDPTISIKYHTDKLTFFLDDYDPSFETLMQDQVFFKNKSKDIFECDLNKLRSWFGDSLTRRQIFLQFPDYAEPIKFLGVITKSILHHAVLTCDIETNTIIGKFNIHGGAEYAVDIFYENELLLEKVMLEDSKFTYQTELRSGNYLAIVFEVETDDSGFGDDSFTEIGRQTLSLLNPFNLNGKCLAVTGIRNNLLKNATLSLDYRYIIESIHLEDESNRNIYLGKMVVLNEKRELRATFIVKVEFSNLENLRFMHLTYDNDGEDREFLYDDTKRIFVKKENFLLTKPQAYRRYKHVLFPEDYSYAIEFLPSTYVCVDRDLDDAEYNNDPNSYRTFLGQKDKCVEVPKIDVMELNISKRWKSVLEKNGISTLQDLCRLGYNNLFRLRNIGKKDIQELLETLNYLGYTFLNNPGAATNAEVLPIAYSQLKQVPAIVEAEQTIQSEFDQMKISKNIEESEQPKQPEIVKDILDTRIEECGFRSMTYNCLKKSGIKTLRDLKVFVEYKGIKGLYHIEKLNGHMRDEVKDLIYHYDFK